MSNGLLAVAVVRPDFLTTQLEPGPGLGACLVISFFDGTVAPPGCIPRTSLIYWWPRFSIDPFANSPSVPFAKSLLLPPNAAQSIEPFPPSVRGGGKGGLRRRRRRRTDDKLAKEEE